MPGSGKGNIGLISFGVLQNCSPRPSVTFQIPRSHFCGYMYARAKKEQKRERGERKKEKKRGGYYKTLRRVSFHDGNSYIRQEAYGAFRISRPRSALPLSSPRSANPSRPIAVPFFSLQTAVEMSEGSAMLLELGLAPFCFTIFLYHL